MQFKCLRNQIVECSYGVFYGNFINSIKCMSSSKGFTSPRGTTRTAKLAMHLIEVQTIIKPPKLGQGVIPKMNMKNSKLPYKVVDPYQMTKVNSQTILSLKELDIIVQQKGVVCKQ